MPLIASKTYDPPAFANFPASGFTAFAAFDTVNLRAVFTVPANGRVLVRISVSTTGPTPAIVLGVLNGATVAFKKRASQLGNVIETFAVVDNLTPGSSLTWDAAYCLGGTNTFSIRYGGPNDASGDAYGAFSFEIWTA